MDTLLLVEDDRFTRYFMREQLELHDMLILEAISGKRSLEILQQHAVDVILLDLGLPDGNGLDLIQGIREYSNVPLIIVSSDKTEASRITALERGADGFILKPVSAKELIAHIQAHLRRYRTPNTQEDLQQKVNGNDNKINFGKWVMDCAEYQIYDQDGDSGDLTSREFKVLKALIDNAGHVMNRDELAKAASEDNYVATSRAIDVKITRIRKKIGDNVANPQIIKTVRGVGYMFA